MKHGIYYAFWEDQWAADYPYYAAKVGKLGFDILEVGAAPLPDYTQDEIIRLRDAARENHVALTAGYGPTYDHNIGAREKTVREGAFEWYKKLFEVMEALNITKIGGALYSYWPVDFQKADKQEDWKYSVEGMRKLAPLAKKHGIMLCMEVLNRFECHILNTAEEGVQFVREVEEDNVKVMLDTFHMNVEEESIGGAIRTAGDLLGHFHTGECNRMPPGKGRMPWREIGEALKDIGYDDTVVMEPFLKMGGQVGADIKVWRDLSHGATEEQMDKCAKESVRFQRYMLG